MTIAADCEKITNWQDRAAYFMSGILSPFLIIPIFIYIVFSRYTNNTSEFLLYGFVALFFSTVLPFLNIFIGVKSGRITDIHVAVRGERKEPFIVSLIGITLATLILYKLGAPREINVLGLVMILNGIIFFIITLYWKISMHSSVLASVLVSLTMLVNPWFLIGSIIIPFLIWARIKRMRHSFYQGFAATVISAGLTYLLLKSFGI